MPSILSGSLYFSESFEIRALSNAAGSAISIFAFDFRRRRVRASAELTTTSFLTASSITLKPSFGSDFTSLSLLRESLTFFATQVIKRLFFKRKFTRSI